MSKRYALNLQHGERKKAKLDISVSDHHLPLSQAFSSNNKDNELDNWGDDNDDEILLQASQACEQAISSDTSILPEYNMWEPPGSTSTQYQPAPSTSKTAFTFKKPNANPPSAVSTHLKNKCNTISSPLPGIANKFIPDTSCCVNLTDDLVINAKVASGRDNYTYNQILRLQEENEKLKAEYDKLQEKCVTKEGEASILRTQLKSCQVAVDSARMEKTRAQENVKLEYTEKLAVVKSQVAELQTQLEFKNLEIISVKEKCKKLESGRRLTQVTIPNHDISSSYRNNQMLSTTYDASQQIKRSHMTSNAAQTDSRAPFLKLTRTPRKDVCKISQILPLLLEQTDQQHSLLGHNENLQTQSDLSQNKCKVVRTFIRMPSTPGPAESSKEKVNVSSIVEDLVCLTESTDSGTSQDKCCHFIDVINLALNEVLQELEETSRRLSTAFQKEMDERYIDATSSYITIDDNQLLKGQALFKDEQGVSTRRLLAAFAASLRSARGHMLHRLQNVAGTDILDTALRICQLIDHCSVGIHYSGLLLSLTLVMQNLTSISGSKLGGSVRALIASRGPPTLALGLLGLLRPVGPGGDVLKALCPACAGADGSNLKVDYDQGLQLYNTRSCHFQVLLKQVEVALKCVERQRLEPEAVRATDHLTALYGTLGLSRHEQPTRCECQAMLVQVLVYSLRICAVMLDDKLTKKQGSRDVSSLQAACRSGVRALYSCAARSPIHRPHAEGLLADAAGKLRCLDTTELYENMLSELTSTFQSVAEDAPTSYHSLPWEQSFRNLSVTD